MINLFQAEWCPYSAAVRERLTELGIDFVVRQVEPRPEQRAQLAALVAEPSIPVLQTDDGQIFAGPKEIFGYLSGLPEGEWASAHRERYREHAGERRLELTAQELDRLAPLDS